MTRHPNLGSNLEDLLKEDDVLEETRSLAIKRVIAWELQQAMKEKGMTKTAMAEAMRTTRRQLDRVLNPQDGNVTLETLQRAAQAVGRSVRLEFV